MIQHTVITDIAVLPVTWITLGLSWATGYNVQCMHIRLSRYLTVEEL